MIKRDLACFVYGNHGDGSHAGLLCFTFFSQLAYLLATFNFTTHSAESVNPDCRLPAHTRRLLIEAVRTVKISSITVICYQAYVQQSRRANVSVSAAAP